MSETFPHTPDPRVETIEPPLRPMTIELAHNLSMLAVSFFREFYPTSTRSGLPFIKEFSAEDLARARVRARLDVNDQLVIEANKILSSNIKCNR